MENFLNLVQICFIKFSKFYKVFDECIFAECPPNRNFGDAIAVQNLSGIHVWNFVRCFPLEPKFLSRYWYNCKLYITLYWGSTVFERAENGNAVLCNYIDFAVIFQKNCTIKFFIIHWVRAGPKKKFSGPGRKFRPGWHL